MTIDFLALEMQCLFTKKGDKDEARRDKKTFFNVS